MTPVQFPSTLTLQGAPYKVHKKNWKYFVDRLIANKWMLIDNHIPLIEDYDRLSKDNSHDYLYVFFHYDKREVSTMRQEEYQDTGISAYIDFTR